MAIRVEHAGLRCHASPAVDPVLTARLARMRANECASGWPVMDAERILAESERDAAVLADPYGLIGRLQSAIDGLLELADLADLADDDDDGDES